MASYEFIGKTKLARGQSYPIGRSVLDTLLDAEGITTVTGVAFVGSSAEGDVLRATYYGPRHKASQHTLTIWISAVPGRIRAVVQQLVIRNGFPALARWLRQFENRQSLYSRLDHQITMRLATLNEHHVLNAHTDDAQLWSPLY